MHLVDSIVGSVIFLNIILLGFETDDDGWYFVGLAFTLFFTVELIVRLSMNGCKEYFVTSPDRYWNWFDAVLVVLAVVESIIILVFEFDQDPIILGRILRLSKLFRLLRVVRFRMFKQVEVMILRLIAGTSSLRGSMLLLGILIWSVAVLLTQLVGYDESPDSQRFSGFAKERDMLFSNTFLSCLTIFRCINGDCAMSNGTPLIPWLTEAYGVAFAIPFVLVYVLFVYGVLNLVMSL